MLRKENDNADVIVIPLVPRSSPQAAPLAHNFYHSVRVKVFAGELDQIAPNSLLFRRVVDTFEERDNNGSAIEVAQVIYGAKLNDDVDFDDDAAVSRACNGAWVQAWLWVKDTEEASS